MGIEYIKTFKSILLVVGLILISCQTPPISKKDDIESISTKIIANLKQQAPKKISLPNYQEQEIIKSSIKDLLLQKDKRFFPYIRHLKENRLALMISDINQDLKSNKVRQDLPYSNSLFFYKIIVSAYTNPFNALNEFNLININDKPQIWKSLKTLLSQRLNSPENRLAYLSSELINAQREGDTQGQIVIHKQLFDFESSQNNPSKMIFHLQKIIELSPNNDIEKLANYQTLINLYKKNRQYNLFVSTAQKALELAKLLGEFEQAALIESELGFNVDSTINEYTENEYASIDNLLKSIKSNSKNYLNFNNLFIIANKYKDLGDTRNALSTIIRALRIARSLKKGYNEAIAIKLIGDIARINGDLKQSYLQYSLAYEIFKTKKKIQEQLLTLSKIAVISIYNDDLKAATRAFDNYLKIIKSSSSSQITQELFEARYQAELFILKAWENKNFDETDPIWTDSIVVLRDHPENVFLEEVMGTAAIVSNKLNQSQLAIKFYNISIALTQKEKKYFKEARYRTNLALLYHNLNQKEESLLNLHQAGIIFKSLRSPYAQEITKMINQFSRQ